MLRIVVLLLMLSTTLFAQPATSKEYWDSYSKAEKKSFLVGWYGASYTIRSAHDNFLLVPSISESLMDSLNLNVREEVLNYMGIAEQISLDQIINGIDNYYADDKNSHVEFRGAIYIAKLRYGGGDPTLIDDKIRYFRMSNDDRLQYEIQRVIEMDKSVNKK